MLYTWSGFSDQNLTPLCTSTCSKSIESYRSKVIKACADDVYTDPPVESTGYVLGTNVQDDIYNSHDSVRPIALADYYFVNYKLLCLKNDESKAFCYSETSNGTNPTGSNCTSCIFGSMRIQLEDATTFDEELLSQYSSIAESCKTTVASVTTPSPVFIEDASTKTDKTTPTTKPCSGSSVAVPTKQSCDDFAFAHNISTSRLLSLNHLIGGCVDWPGESPKLCIEGNCKPYKVKNGDTCRSVARAHGITQTQLTGWNYFIDPYCKNFEQQVGHIICVSDPSGYTPPKRPGAGAGTVTTAAPLPTNAQSKSNKNCGKWYMPKKGKDEGCAELINANGITLDDFLFLNPQINKKCTNMLADTMYCVKAVGDISTYISYHGYTPTPTTTKERKTINLEDLPRATRIPSWASLTISTGLPMASGSVERCKVPFNNKYGNLSCEVAVRVIGIDLYNWLKWNPSVVNGEGPLAYKPGHCFLQNNTQYCGIAYDQSKFPPKKSDKYVPVPDDATENATNKCESWYDVYEHETCDGILQDFDIPLWALAKWNPSVGSKCEKFQTNVAYCVQGPGWDTMSYEATQSPETTSPDTATQKPAKTTPTAKEPLSSTAGTTAKNTASETASGPPAPTQSGIVKNCQKWYVTRKGDGCQNIAGQFKITLKQFYSWNPAVGTDCKNLWVKEAYCVSAGKN
ncbi:hypothetical protein ACHAPJ_011941 [Fusarium lateritium]